MFRYTLPIASATNEAEKPVQEPERCSIEKLIEQNLAALDAEAVEAEADYIQHNSHATLIKAIATRAETEVLRTLLKAIKGRKNPAA